MATVRVLTWNLWWRFGDWRRRWDAIATVLRDVQPDICCFQEVWSTPSEDAAGLLGEAVGLPHCQRSYSDQPERWQVEAVVKFVMGLGHGPFPPVVAGDLNAEPDSDEVRLLGGYKTAPVVPDQFFIDAWRRADDADPGWTWLRDNPHVPAPYSFNARIDYLHVGPAGPNGEGAIRQVMVEGDYEVDGTWPSDHCAVVADLELSV